MYGEEDGKLMMSVLVIYGCIIITRNLQPTFLRSVSVVSLSRRFWLRVPHEVAVKMSARDLVI